MTRLTIFLALFISTAAIAGPQIQSVSPASAPTTGGLEITVIGTGFASTAQVRFGDTHATETRFVNDTTLIAVTPPHLPGLSHVEVSQTDGNDFEVFTFHGQVPAAFERVLLPTLTEPVNGAFGSIFKTEFRAAARTTDPVRLYGLSLLCDLTCIQGSIDFPPTVGFNHSIDPSEVFYTGTPGQFVLVPTSDVGRLSANLRVYDTTRADANFGTEIPIVRQRDFIDPRERIVLLGVPTNPMFRNTLRVYSYDLAAEVAITVEGQETKYVQMGGATKIFEPAYAVFTDFPTGFAPVNVTVELVQPNISADARQPFWAFVTVTNNETQLISTISPQP